MDDRVHQIENRIASKRRSSSEQEAEYRSQRPEVGAVIEGKALYLLGRHVLRCADERVGSRDVARANRRCLRFTGRREARLNELREPKVEDLHDPAARAHQVRRFQIPVDDTGGVRFR